MSVYSKLSALLTAANTTTGESDTTLTDAVQTLIDGYGSGGGGGGISIEDIATNDFLSGSYTINSQLAAYALDNKGKSSSSWTLKYNGGLGANRSLSNTSGLTALVITNVSYYSSVFYSSGHDIAILDTSETRFPSSAWEKCGNLKTVILRNSSVVTVNNVNLVNQTPFASNGSGGTIYIPKSLYDHLGDGSSSDYKAATNWSTINGYGKITWAKIEGSIYETHYGDGSVIE